METFVQLSLQKNNYVEPQLQNFLRHDNIGIWLRVEYQCWRLQNFTLADQKWEFVPEGAESYEIFIDSAAML
jgi:hypothetical protein